MPKSEVVPTVLEDNETLFLSSATTSVRVSRWRRQEDRIEATFAAFDEVAKGHRHGVRFERSDGKHVLVKEWAVDGVLELLDGEVLVRRVSLAPSAALLGRNAPTPAGGVTSRLAQSVVGPLMQRGLSIARSLVPWGLFPGDMSTDEFRRNVVEVKDDARTPRYDDAHFLRVARGYIALQRRGLRDGLMKQLALDLNVNENTLRTSWVPKAQKRGFLTAAAQGHAASRGPGPNYTEEN